MVRLIAQQQEELEAYVLDTKNIGIGAGFSAIQAAKWLEEGVEWDQLISNLNELVERTKVFFCCDIGISSKGGRIGLVASIVGTALKLNPIISCNEEGIYYTVGKARDVKSLIKRLLTSKKNR